MAGMKPERVEPLRFIGESIQVAFDEMPAREKSPPCPNRFV